MTEQPIAPKVQRLPAWITAEDILSATVAAIHGWAKFGPPWPGIEKPLATAVTAAIFDIAPKLSGPTGDELAKLQGQVQTIRSLCDGILRFGGTEETASVTVAELRRIIDAPPAQTIEEQEVRR